MNAADGLHPAAIAMAEANAVDRLRTARVGRAEAGNWNGIFVAEQAGHAGRPKLLAANVGVDETVDVRKFRQRRRGAVVDAGNEFQLRFAEIRGDVGVRQRRP